jgi:diguanylate cyclase (GGDEF)-like protein
VKPNDLTLISQQAKRKIMSILYSKVVSAILFNAAVALAFFFIYADTENRPEKLVWLFAVLFTSFLRLSDYAYWLRVLQNTEYDARNALFRFSLGALVTATLWSLYGIYFFSYMDANEYGIVMIVFMGSASSASSVLAGNTRIAVSYMAILILPTAIMGMLSDDNHSFIVGLLGVCYVIIGLITSLKTSEFTMRSVYNETQNDFLLKRQADIMQEMEEKNKEILHIKERTKEIWLLSNQDPLTQLSNRAAIDDTLEELLEQSKHTNEPVALLFIDLDGFKIINDTHGHFIGDEVIKAAADKLKRIVELPKYASRWGGDEFVLALPNTQSEEAMSVAKLVIEALSIPHVVQDTSLTIGATIGIAMCPEHETNASKLIAQADKAMYAQKMQEKSQARMYTTSLEIAED